MSEKTCGRLLFLMQLIGLNQGINTVESNTASSLVVGGSLAKVENPTVDQI